MSFVLLDEEQAATLEEALAFLESHTDGNTSTEEGTSSDHSSSPLISSRSPSEDAHRVSSDGNDLDRYQYRPQKKQKQVEQRHSITSRASNTRAVNQYRQRTKAEIINLREQAEQLSARVLQLRKREALAVAGQASLVGRSRDVMTTSNNSLSPSSMGLDLAVAEYRKLQESQQLNRKLKEALEKQAKMNKVLETFFQRQFAKNVRTPLCWNLGIHTCTFTDRNILMCFGVVLWRVGPAFRARAREKAATDRRPRRHAHFHGTVPLHGRSDVRQHSSSNCTDQHERYHLCVQQLSDEARPDDGTSLRVYDQYAIAVQHSATRCGSVDVSAGL